MSEERSEEDGLGCGCWLFPFPAGAVREPCKWHADLVAEIRSLRGVVQAARAVVDAWDVNIDPAADVARLRAALAAAADAPQPETATKEQQG